jgi:hypothetical protein
MGAGRVPDGDLGLSVHISRISTGPVIGKG